MHSMAAVCENYAMPLKVETKTSEALKSTEVSMANGASKAEALFMFYSFLDPADEQGLRTKLCNLLVDERGIPSENTHTIHTW